MQKEKSVRAYQRKSKNGKVVTVHSYKAKYDAAEEARKEMAKRAGAGEEFKKKKSSAPADLGFTADEFKIWANDLDVKEAKRIDKILVKKYGEKAVQKLADEINAGNSRTYKAVFARLSSEKPVKKVATKATKSAPNTDAKSKIDYNSFAEKKLKKYKSWKVSKQGSGYVLINPNSDPYRSSETLRVSPSFATSLMEYQKGNKEAIKSYANTLKKEDEKRSAEHEKKTSKTTKTTPKSSEKTTKTKSSQVISKSRPTDAPKSQRDSYERHVSSQISGGHQTLSQIMETLAASGKWSNDEKMRRAAQRIYDRQK